MAAASVVAFAAASAVACAVARVVAGVVVDIVASAAVLVAASAVFSVVPAANGAFFAVAHVPVGAAEGGTADSVEVVASPDVAATAVGSIVARVGAPVGAGCVVCMVARVAAVYSPLLVFASGVPVGEAGPGSVGRGPAYALAAGLAVEVDLGCMG